MEAYLLLEDTEKLLFAISQPPAVSRINDPDEPISLCKTPLDLHFYFSTNDVHVLVELKRLRRRRAEAYKSEMRSSDVAQPPKKKLTSSK